MVVAVAVVVAVAGVILLGQGHGHVDDHDYDHDYPSSLLWGQTPGVERGLFLKSRCPRRRPHPHQPPTQQPSSEKNTPSWRNREEVSPQTIVLAYR